MNSVSDIGSGLQYAQSGIGRGLAKLSQDAQQVADATSQPGGGADQLTNALVDADQQRLVVESSARALSIMNQTLGTLLDVKA